MALEPQPDRPQPALPPCPRIPGKAYTAMPDFSERSSSGWKVLAATAVFILLVTLIGGYLGFQSRDHVQLPPQVQPQGQAVSAQATEADHGLIGAEATALPVIQDPEARASADDSGLVPYPAQEQAVEPQATAQLSRHLQRVESLYRISSFKGTSVGGLRLAGLDQKRRTGSMWVTKYPAKGPPQTWHSGDIALPEDPSGNPAKALRNGVYVMETATPRSPLPGEAKFVLSSLIPNAMSSMANALGSISIIPCSVLTARARASQLSTLGDIKSQGSGGGKYIYKITNTRSVAIDAQVVSQAQEKWHIILPPGKSTVISSWRPLGGDNDVRVEMR